MEGNKVIQDAYNACNKAIKANSTGSITINYNDFDENTQSVLRLAINGALEQRKRELWNMLSGVK